MSVLSYCVVCCGGNSKQNDINRVDNIVKKVGRIIGTEQERLETLYNKSCERKLRKILADRGHALYERFKDSIISRSGRMRLATATTNPYQRSSVPRAMKIYNNLSL